MMAKLHNLDWEKISDKLDKIKDSLIIELPLQDESESELLLFVVISSSLNEELKNNGVNKELYDSDKYVWLQTIKNTVKQKIKDDQSTKSTLAHLVGQIRHINN